MDCSPPLYASRASISDPKGSQPEFLRDRSAAGHLDLRSFSISRHQIREIGECFFLPMACSSSSKAADIRLHIGHMEHTVLQRRIVPEIGRFVRTIAEHDQALRA